MTPIDIKGVCSLRSSLWPRAKWETEEMSVFAEHVGRMDLEYAQAAAVLREIKATRASWPAVSVLLEALRGAASPRSPVTQSPMEIRSRADYMRHLFRHEGIEAPGTDADVLRAFWLSGCYR